MTNQNKSDAASQGSSGKGKPERRPHDTDGFESATADDRGRRDVRRTLAERLLAGLSESGDVLRKGQDLVAEVASGTRDEVARLVSAEVRRFLDGIDAQDLVREILEGLVVEVNAEVRFRKSGDAEASGTKIAFRTDRRPTSNAEKDPQPAPARTEHTGES